MDPNQGAASAPEGVSSRADLQALLWRMRATLERVVAEAGPARLDVPGATGDWTLKDVIAHLNGWRWWSVARLEAAVRGAVPTPPWGGDLDEENADDVDRINEQFYAANRDRPAIEVLRDSRETLDRLEAALLSLPEADLFRADRFPWLNGYPASAVIVGSAGHLFEDHEPAIDAFLARASQD